MNNPAMTMLYDTLLSIPSMNETVKVDMRISRKLILLLKQAVEAGLVQQRGETTTLLSAMPQGADQELLEIVEECLGKAGLTELYGKLQSFTQAK